MPQMANTACVRSYAQLQGKKVADFDVDGNIYTFTACLCPSLLSNFQVWDRGIGEGRDLGAECRCYER